ncbi:MAG TPA: acetoacetate decarboxylase family protein [Acidimicrobiales bacterium]|nr:acetoacetate decarboxylase family protein [Acidimicrobiales bacterium]
MTRYAAMEAEPPAPGGEQIVAQNLVALFETDADLVASVLPRPLVPTEPIVRLTLAQVDMPGAEEPLGAGTFAVQCRHDGTDGFYDLLMIMNREAAVVGGRETFGEPKKLGHAWLRHEGGEVAGVMGRQGVDLAEIRGRVAEDLEPQAYNERSAFYFKFLLDPAGGGFDAEPELVHVRRGQQDLVRQRVEGDVVLRDSRFDPVAELPVRSLLSIVWTESHQTQRGEIVGRVPSEWVWPFRHQRYDGLIARLQPASR